MSFLELHAKILNQSLAHFRCAETTSLALHSNSDELNRWAECAPVREFSRKNRKISFES